MFCSYTPFNDISILSQLFGYQNPITLHVFVGTDAGKVKPHGFYQACKVCGKNSTSCEEKDVDGTTVIEIALDPKDDMKARYVF